MKKALIAAGAFVLNAFTFISFYAAFKSIKAAILWSLPVLVGCLLTIIGSLCCQLNSLQKNILEKEKEASNMNSSHEQSIADVQGQLQQAEKDKAALEKQVESLKLQNKIQREKITFIEDHWKELDSLFRTALQRSKSDRFEEAYRLYLIKTNTLFNRDKEVF